MAVFQNPSSDTQSEGIPSDSENPRDDQLYKAVQRRSTESILSQLKDGAYLGTKRGSLNSSAVTLILQLPNGIEILKERLDEAISIENGENSSKKIIKFDYANLVGDIKNSKQQMEVIKDILNDSRKHLISNLIQHPIVESIIFLKWKKIRFFFIIYLLFYILLMSILTYYVTLVVSSELTPNQNVTNSTSATSILNMETTDVRTPVNIKNETKPTAHNVKLSLILFIPFLIFSEFVESVTFKLRHFQRFETWINISFLVTFCIVIFSKTPWLEWVYQMSAVTVLLGWFQVNFLLARLPTFGVYILVFYSVAKHFLKFIAAYFFFLIGFSFTFYLMFTKQHDGPFNSPWTSVLRTLALMLGDHDYDKYMAEKKHNLGTLANVIYFFFLFLVSLVFMNLLIGLAVNDMQELQKTSRVERLRKQAEFIMVFENICARCLDCCCSCFQDRFYSMININSNFSVNPAVGKIFFLRKDGFRLTYWNVHWL